MARAPVKILLQTTIPTSADDWSINRFSGLAELLRDARGLDGALLYAVTARDRDPGVAPDAVLSMLDRTDYDQLWLFAVDTGEGLTEADCDGISRFRAGGRGMMVTRDHMDLGSSICKLGGVGQAHHFHTRNLDPDETRHQIDDPFTTAISWPNFHSGANGDFQVIAPAEPLHPVLRNPASPTGAIRFLPSHPHEGAVGAPAGAAARVIAEGTSRTTGRRFNLAVAFEHTSDGGRAIAESTFHHFADYNWNPSSGAPSFVTEAPGGGLAASAEATADVQCYALNIAHWLAGAD